MQSKKDAMSRCSSTYFRKVINKLEPKLNERQRARIIGTPFGKWLKMPKLSIYSTRVDVILRSFNIDSLSFVFGKGIVIPFTSFEFSIVIGLPHGGQPVNQELGTNSDFLSRYFAGKLIKATRKSISENLLLMAESEDDSHLDDFVRMFILFAFNCIVFPLSTYLTPRFVFSYIDDLTNFFGYSWGDAAHRFLCVKISGHIVNSEGASGRKTYLDGCVVGLMAWVYEKVPSLGVVSGSPRTYPRLFKWCESKISLKVEEAESLLKRITCTKVSYKMKDAETMCKIKRLEKLVEDQFNEIQMLKQMCCQSDGMVTKNVVGGRVDCEVNVGKKDDKNVSFEDFDIDLGGYHGFHDVDVVQNVIKGDAVGLTEVGVEINKVHTEESSREIIDESNDVNCVSGSQNDTVSNVISSIVKNVLTRTNRVKKRKPDMFVTPPSSTPRRKTKAIVECKEYTVLSDEGDTNIEDEKISADKDELNLKNFRGREDFCGCEEVSEKERNVIMNYLTGERLSGSVWEGERFKIFGIDFCDLLFGNALKGNIIDCYMKIVSEYNVRNGFEIFCMDTTVQDEVLGALQRLNRKQKLNDDGYRDFFFIKFDK
ncbi:uncharacterized protein [Primulina eburnea]|uniref:uncharacterized protein isoform X2 n=1 Tax=Primulina eburnea TaxID=1245227 RepID=UPI003C6BF1E2